MSRAVGKLFCGMVAVAMGALSLGAGEIKWIKDDLGKALEEAKKKQGFVMVDVVAEWCAPCKMMDKTTWKDDKVIKAIDELKLIPVKIDGDKMGAEKSLGKYNIRGFPTLLFLDAEGGEIGRKVGFDPEGDFVAAMKAAMKDTRSEKEIRAAIEKDPSDASSLFTLSSRLKHRSDEASHKERASLLDRAYKADPENAKGIGAQAMVDRISMAIPLVIQAERAKANLDKLEKGGWLLGLAWGEKQDPQMPERLAALKKSVLDIAAAVEKDITAQLQEARLAAQKFKNPNAEMDEMVEAFMRPQGVPSPAPLIEDALYDLAPFVASSPEALNQVAFRNYQRQKELPASEALARKALAAAPGNTNIMDTLAHILYSVGKKDEALKMQRDAVALAKKDEAPNLEQLEASLKSLESGKLDQLEEGVTPAVK